MFNSQGKFHLHTSHQISSHFSILHVHTGTANSRKAWKDQNIKKGMEVPEHQETTVTCITTTLRKDVQHSREVQFTSTQCQISSYFPILHVHTGTANSRKAWKYQNIKKQLKLVYKNTILPSYFIAIETFHCPNFKPRDSQEF